MSPDQAIIVDALRKTEHAQRRHDHHRTQDEAWAEYYSNYLLEETDFSTGSQRSWQPDELTQALTDLDIAYSQAQRKQGWAEYVARRLTS